MFYLIIRHSFHLLVLLKPIDRMLIFDHQRLKFCVWLVQLHVKQQPFEYLNIFLILRFKNIFYFF